MTKLTLTILLFIGGFLQASAQFNPDAAERSLVKIIVTQNGSNLAGVCSGIIWKQNSWIVTSLHAMKPSGIIQVVYPGNNIRNAKVIKVLQEADLVLLNTDIDTRPLTSAVTPLSSFHNGEVPFGEKIYAIGFNGGSKGNQTQSLEKGHANPETLEFLVRAEDAASLKQVGFPSMSLPIYFLSGSLLPGFSGSPVYNQNNELIGIGDGGLERGMMNVSWCIPAYNLSKLENSVTTSLPSNLSKAASLYSAEVSIQLPKENESVNSGETNGVNAQQLEDMSQTADSLYTNFTFGNYDLYQTKTRTWNQMKQTAIDPENMDSIISDLGIKTDLSYLSFDIYEDVNSGFVIAVPELADLQVFDKDAGIFSARLSDLDMEKDNANKYFQLYYFATDTKGDPAGELIDFLAGIFTPASGGKPQLLPQYTKTYKINDEWTADYRAFMASLPLQTQQLGNVVAFYWLSTIHNKDSTFDTIASAFIPVGRQDLINDLTNGLDCSADYSNHTSECDYFESLLKVLAAAHLTTISSLY